VEGPAVLDLRKHKIAASQRGEAGGNLFLGDLAERGGTPHRRVVSVHEQRADSLGEVVASHAGL
jgi:mannose/fructose-specific phosphotransferase system component IIA